MTDRPTRVLIVDDTVTYRKIISIVLEGVPEVEVVGTAANGRIAVQKAEQLRPDLLTLDLEMPEMDGLDVLRWLKQNGSDAGAIMLSGTTAQGAQATITALELGAFDFVLKPVGGQPEENIKMLRERLRPRIQAFARTRRHDKDVRHQGPPPPAGQATTVPKVGIAPRRMTPAIPRRFGPAEAIAVGISTGGPKALTRMLPQLPADLPVPVFIVQHMPPVFTKSLANDLDKRCKVTVFEAEDGQPVVGGHVLIAPGGKQMKVRREEDQVVVRITDDPPENSCKPSVDYLFRSVLDIYGQKAVGVIMTGMGNDGRRGCREMKRKGASIVAQDESTCVVFGMPKGPIEEGIVDVVAPLDSIAAEIVRLIGTGAASCK